MARAQIFRYRNGQAVRLPAEFRIDSDEVEILRRGEEIVLRESPRDMRRAFQLITELPETILSARDERPPSDRGNRRRKG